jgi:hypothetical protein
MANYFSMALMEIEPSWLMNLLEGMLTSWRELCRQLTTNFESAYSPLGNETDLHAIQQRPREIVFPHLVFLSGSQHHPSYLQCVCCGCISLGCER